MSKIEIDPVYGWGWRTDSNNESIDVPPKFYLNILNNSESSVFGIIETPHIYAGMNAELSLRAEAQNIKFWNVCLTRDKVRITGYAKSSH